MMFFDQWEYCLSFYLREVSCLRDNTFDPVKIDAILDERQHWRAEMARRWSKHEPKITSETRHNLKHLADQLAQQAPEFKLVVSVSRAWIYTNSTQVLDDIQDLPYIKEAALKQVVITQPKDTVLLRNPRHGYRSYFRGIKMSVDDKKKLRDFLHNYPDIRRSPSLEQWLQKDWQRTLDNFFVDHDDQRWLLLLALIRPGLIRKTMQIMAK